MKRKIIRQGHNTLTVTLPRGWCDNVKLKGGDEVDIKELEAGLMISTLLAHQQRSITYNIDNIERLSLAKFLIACFEQGYSSITLTFSKTKIKSWSHGEETLTDTVKFFVARLVGFEVLSQTAKSITIGNLSEKLTKFENIMSRIFFLNEEYLQQFIIALKTNDSSDLKNRENRHDNITKLVALGLRMVSEDTSRPRDESLNYFTILNYIDKVADFIRYAYKYAEKGKVNKETIMLAERSLKYLELYRHFFYKFDMSKVNELDELRGEIKKRFLELASKGKDPEVNSQFDAMTETVHGIVKSRIALELATGKLDCRIN